MRKHAVAVAICGCFLNLALGADTVQYGPVPPWVKPVTQPQDDGAMAQAPVKVLLRNHQVRFSSSGLDAYTETLVRLQTAQGLQSMGTFALPWKPDADVLTVHKLQLLRGDQVIDVLAAGQKFEVLRRENNLEYAALDGTLTGAIQPNGMEVGDVVNIAFTVQHVEQASRSPELILSGLNQAPASRVEVRVTWDKGVALRWRATDEVKGIKESRNGNQTELTWTATNLSPITQPSNVPLRFWKEPRIDFSSYPSWNDTSRKLAPLYASAAQLQANSPLKAEARAIADSTKDPVARLESALKLTQDRVRYVYLGMGDGGVTPASADDTWKRRFGDCKAKSTLLIALLHEMGIPSEPVVVNTQAGDMVGDLLPMVGAFDHVIVRANAGGKFYWLDGAGSGSWQRDNMSTPNFIWGLPLTAKGDGLLRMIAEPAALPQAETSTFIDAKAGLHTDAPFKAEARFRGAFGAGLNAQLSGLSPADREQALRRLWKAQYDFLEVATVTSEYDEISGVETLSVTGSADMNWGGYTYTSDGMSVGARADFSRKPGINEDAPFAHEHPIYIVNRQRIELPRIGTFSTTGKNYDVTLAGTHYLRKSAIESGVFVAEASTRTLVTEIPAVEARAAEKRLNDMARDRLEIVAKGYRANDADVAAIKTRKFTDAANLMWRGMILLERADYEGAKADFDAVIKLDGKNYRAVAHRGLVYFWTEKYDLAKSDFDMALANEPNNEIALRGLGVYHRYRGEFPAAIERLSASLTIDPDNTFALVNRAYAYAVIGLDKQALEDTWRTIVLRPDMIDMYDLRATILSKQDDPGPAVGVVQAMLVANPDSVEAQRAAARNYSRLGLYREAVAASDAAIAKEPKAANYLLRADVRDPAETANRLADVDAALTKKPDYQRAIRERARLLSVAGDHQGAIASYTSQLKAETQIGRKRRLFALRGIELLKVGQSAAAASDLSAALAGNPGADAYNDFCWDLAAARVNLDDALAACEKAVAIKPKAPHFLDSKGFALLQLGRFDEAIVAYDSALAIQPLLAPSLYGRGLAKKRRCKCDAGDADLKAGRLDDPTVVHLYAEAGLTP